MSNKLKQILRSVANFFETNFWFIVAFAAGVCVTYEQHPPAVECPTYPVQSGRHQFDPLDSCPESDAADGCK